MTATHLFTKLLAPAGCTVLALLLVSLGWASFGKSAAQSADGSAQAAAAFSSGGPITLQGQLTTVAGALLNGSDNLRLAIYDAPSAGIKRWLSGAYEEHPAVAVTDGLLVGAVVRASVALKSVKYFDRGCVLA